MMRAGDARRATIVFLVLGAFLGGVALGRWRLPPQGTESQRSSSSTVPAAIDTSLVREVWDTLHEKYSGTIDDAKLSRGILRGLVGGLGDPYSAYADPDETSQFSGDLSGSFAGIGVEIGMRRGLVTVIAPLKGTPAERAGLKAQDAIIAVNGQEITADTTLTDVVSKIRGPVGTRVTLRVFRERDAGPKDIEVTREQIRIESVHTRIENHLGIVELTTFHERTPQEFTTAARTLLQANVRGLVLDLRNNPGGILQSAVDVAGHFLEPGSLVVTEVSAPGMKPEEHRAAGPGDLRTLPVVVLINEGSASASEILAGALRDNRHVSLIGSKTFGKGTVQELVDLSDGSSVRITIAKWLTPSGQEIANNGLHPDSEVTDEDPDDERDEVLLRGLEAVGR